MVNYGFLAAGFINPSLAQALRQISEIVTQGKGLKGVKDFGAMGEWETLIVSSNVEEIITMRKKRRRAQHTALEYVADYRPGMGAVIIHLCYLDFGQKCGVNNESIGSAVPRNSILFINLR